MRKAVALYGVTEETLALIPVLLENAEIELAGAFADDVAAARARAAAQRATIAIDSNPALFTRSLHAVVDAGTGRAFAERFPEAAATLQVVSPLTARLLWGYGVSSSDRKSELLQALHEVVESVNLTVDPDELFARMLEIAKGVTGADGGSLMLLDAQRGELSIRVASGVEPELWPKIRVKLGEGVAGRAAAEARPIKVRGRADREQFRLSRERGDISSALCVPLVHDGRVLGVLNLHNTTREDAFDDDDLAFAEQLGRLDAAIIARAQEHECLRRQASRYTAVQAVREALGGGSAIEARLEALCARVAQLAPNGIATLYLLSDDELRLAATSLPGGGLGGEYRIALGAGVDGRAARDRTPVFLDSEPGALAYAALPLLAGDACLGVLSVQTSGAKGRPGRALRETLLEIAAAAAEEIAHAEREARSSARATKVSAINESGVRLLSTRDPAEVARMTTSSGALILESDHAVLRLQDAESKRFVIRSYYGSADARAQEALFKLDKQLCVEALKARQPRLLRNLAKEPAYAALAGGIRSALVAPLKRDGRATGTLAFYDRVASDQFFPGLFSDDDLQVFARYVSYVERALENAAFHAATAKHRNFDEETGLPNADYWGRRLDQELARAAGRENALAILACRIENLAEIRRADTRRADRVLQRTAEALRNHCREFDVVARGGDAELLVLLPDPGSHPEERVASLARQVAEEVARDDAVATPVRPALAFGYAAYPSEGAEHAALVNRTKTPRIRMV
ncbi:MAG: GAF domain-containing protein [Myxococcota bacterium]